MYAGLFKRGHGLCLPLHRGCIGLARVSLTLLDGNRQVAEGFHDLRLGTLQVSLRR